MYRTISLVLGALLGTAVLGQILVNGSFEEAGQFSANGWTGTCTPPGEGAEGAPGSGLWHATVQPGQFKGCFPSYVYQTIPGAQNGDRYLLIGWVRCDTEEPCLGSYIGIGRTNGTEIEVDDLSGGQFTDWTFVEITDTIEVDDGEVAAVVITAGSIGGPVMPNPAHFDGLQLDLAMAVEDEAITRIHHVVDHAQGTLSLSSGNDPITGIRLFDLTGRQLNLVQRQGLNTIQVDLNGLPGGAYFAQVRTRNVERTIRFTTW